MRASLPLTLLALVGVSCQNKPAPTTPPAPLEPAPREARKRVTPSLWDYAPTDATLGFVARDGSLAELHAVMLEMKRIAGSMPAGAQYIQKFSQAFAIAGIDPFKRESIESVGIDLGKGLAVFIKAESKQYLVIAPIGDREALRKKLGDDIVKTEVIDGIEYDVGPFKQPVCRSSGERYLCGDTAERVEDALARPDSILRQRALALPANLRGDMQMIVEATAMPDDLLAAIQASGGRFDAAALSANMEKGELELGVRLIGKVRPELLATNRVPKLLLKKSLHQTPVSATHIRLAPSALRLLMKEAKIQNAEIFADAVSGEFLLVASGSQAIGGTIAIGLRNASTLKKDLPTICAGISSETGIRAKMTDGVCTGEFDVRAMATGSPVVSMFFPKPLPFELAIDKNSARFRLATEPGSESIRGVAATRAQKELWLPGYFIAGTHTWTDPTLTNPDSAAAIGTALSNLDRESREDLNLARLLFDHVHAIGYRSQVDDKHAELRFVISTHAAALQADDFRAFGDHALGLINDKNDAELTQFVRQRASKAAAMGLLDKHIRGKTPLLGPYVGPIAAVAVPAFTRYVRRSKLTEAVQFVRKLYDGARVAAMSSSPGGRLPKPSAGPTPPLGTCCRQGGKCAPNPQWWDKQPWRDLSFSVDDPHYYSYEYKVDRKGKSFSVIAHGDLNCDGVYSRIEMRGKVAADGSVPGTAELDLKNELE